MPNCPLLQLEYFDVYSARQPDDPDIAFGLCELGMGCPELGNVLIGATPGPFRITGRVRFELQGR
nr:DUF2958 domain-containing protein [Methylomarinum sp. Ch1-1]MDP4523085.1 DUF2958 domain-containing protein [Methylomarinum sp. Ch1-1]